MTSTDDYTPRIGLKDVMFQDEPDRQVIWHADTDLTMPGGGTQEGLIMVCLDVDGQMDMVYADLRQSGDLASLDRAIAILQRVRDGLDDLYAGRNAAGRCFGWGDWGRCYHRHGHDGDHRFPTEADQLPRLVEDSAVAS